jgi:TP901 family phage tail tape measure protein
MAIKVGELYFGAGIETSGFNRDAARMESRIGQSTKKIQGMGGKMGKGLSSAFTSLGINPMVGGIAAVGAAIGAVGKQAYEFSKKFDSAMLEVKTISGSVQEDFEGMKQGVMDISMLPIKDDAIGLSEALYQIVSAGHDGADGLKVLEAAAKAATGGVTTTETAADGLTTVLNAWGMEAERVNEVSDVMFTAVKLGKTTMGELSSSIAQVAPLASSMGVSMEEVFAAVSSLTKQGTPTAQAMTQIRSSLVNMNKALGEGWSDQMTYQEGLQKIAEKAGGSKEELKKLIPDIEGMNAVLGMTGEKAAGAAKDLEDTFNSADAAGDAFKTMADDVDVKWTQVSNKWNAHLDSVGQQLIEMSSGLATLLDGVLTMNGAMGNEYEAMNEKVDGFSDRMKVFKNEGNDFFGALAGAMFRSDEDAQGIIEKEREEAEETKEIISSIREEYQKMKESGASDKELAEFKRVYQERYDIIVKELESEKELMEKAHKDAKKGNWLTLGLQTNEVSRKGIALKDKEDELKGYKAIFETVESLGVEAEKEVDKAVDNTTKNITEKSKGVIEALEEELKALQDKTGTFTNPEQEAANLEAIKAKTLELKDAWTEVREHYNKANNLDGVGDMKKMESKGVKGVAAIDPKPLNESLAPMKKLTKEEKEQLEATQKKLDAERDVEVKREAQRDTLIETSEALYESQAIMGELANLIGQFDEEAGESVAKFADMAGQAGGLAANLASGNWAGAIASGIGLVSSVIESFKSDGVDGTEKYIKALERNNELLEKQLGLSTLLKEEEWVDYQRNKLRKLNRDLETYNQQLRDIEIRSERSHGTIDTSNWDLAKWIEALSDDNNLYNFDYDRLDAVLGQIQFTTEKIDEIESELENRYNEFFENLTGISSDDITSSLVNGIMDGLELAENGLGDFADNFQGLMEQAALQAMTKSFNQDHLKNIQRSFELAMADDGVIDDTEMAALQDDYADAVRAMQDKAEAWSHVIGENTEEAKDEGMKGDIKGITEKTAGQLEGRINSIQMNVIGLKEIGQSQLQTLEAIRHNTSYNFHLEALDDMSSDLRVMRQRQNDLISSIQDSNNGGVTI